MAKYINLKAAEDLLTIRAAQDNDRNRRTWAKAAAALIEVPVADVVEVKHGHWKPFDLTWGRSVYACTACGEAFEVPTKCGEPMYKWCPFCGAKMDEVEQDG